MDAREPPRLPTSEPLSMATGSNSYGGGIPSSSMTTMGLTGMLPSNMRLPFNSIAQPAPKPMEASASLYHADSAQAMHPCSGVFSMSEPMRKKRGRPRKYGPEGSMALALSPLSPASGYSNSPMSDPSAKRRGRPPGSGKKQQLEALGSAGTSFTPHVITVKAGEDVASKILAFSQQGSRTVCILSANGTICNVTLRQPATSGGTVTYEGRFEILSLSGSYLLIENGGTRSRTGGLSVALAGSDGRVLGGGVAGMLMAATPVQVFMGSFIADGKKPKPEPIKHEPTSAPPQIPGFGTGSVPSPPLQGTSSESSDNPSSPNEQSGGTCNNSSQHVQSVPLYASVGWPHSMVQHRHDPDVKMAHN